MAAEGSFRAAAPAKLNLYLHVEGRRTDGYHRLDSLIAFAQTGDVVTVAPARTLTLSVGGPFARDLPPPDDNLVLRAAALLRDRIGTSDGAAIRLDKNLPVASGIGGGSADAAATLRALAEHWCAGPVDVVGGPIAATLGADVPVCLRCRTSRVGGIGDEIVAAPDLPPVDLLLVNPGIALPTAGVFRRFAETSSPAESGRANAIGWDGIADAPALAKRLADTANDLEPAAIYRVPEIGTVLAALRAARGCLLARMSGSGATCFGLFASARAMQRAAATLRAAQPDWWVAPTRLRTVPPHPERL
jgi:4-diphosphocytidyl-2-C-methyl-D-erythritol kinase